MIDLIIVLVVVAILGMAIAYIRKAKKSGVKCIGCPAAGQCKHNSTSDGCSCGVGKNKV